MITFKEYVEDVKNSKPVLFTKQKEAEANATKKQPNKKSKDKSQKYKLKKDIEKMERKTNEPLDQLFGIKRDKGGKEVKFNPYYPATTNGIGHTNKGPQDTETIAGPPVNM